MKMDSTFINGFSKLTKTEKIEFLSKLLNIAQLQEGLESYWHKTDQELFDGFSENTLTNYYLPYGIAPNFLINGNIYQIPMVIEESSVVASASAAAKFWSVNGGFHAEVISTIKPGHVHFICPDNKHLLFEHWPLIKHELYQSVRSITSNMEQRGGGLIDIILEDCTSLLNNYFRISVTFETIDSMGANFINTVLEQMASTLEEYCFKNFPGQVHPEVIMSILSNYTPDCRVKCWIEAPVEAFNTIDANDSTTLFIDKFTTAIRIAELDINRAVTHNKGIMNGIDAVLLATGNDFRAVEAGLHAYASRNGQYSSLSSVEVKNGKLNLSLELPLTIGTIGGLTSHHPLAKLSLEILRNPTAKELMMIIAATGLATHFSAIRALVTKGIQKGHMKMHLSNILFDLQASNDEKAKAIKWFEYNVVSFKDVGNFIKNLRNQDGQK